MHVVLGDYLSQTFRDYLIAGLPKEVICPVNLGWFANGFPDHVIERHVRGSDFFFVSPLWAPPPMTFHPSEQAKTMLDAALTIQLYEFDGLDGPR